MANRPQTRSYICIENFFEQRVSSCLASLLHAPSSPTKHREPITSPSCWNTIAAINFSIRSFIFSSRYNKRKVGSHESPSADISSMESQLSAVKNLFALCDEEGNVGKRDYDTFLANVVKRLREYMERERELKISME